MANKLVMITGPSGAGRSTAINALEDLGFEAIDNMPLSLLEPLLQTAALNRPLALGFDTRNRDFSRDEMMELIDRLSRRGDISLELVYLDCSSEVLLKRFSETRRRHPMAPAETPDIGIARDKDLLGPVQRRANILIDTSTLTPHDLTAEMARWFHPRDANTLAITIESFSFKRGVPRGLDLMFDVRFLQNPYWVEDLRPFDGRHDAVRDYVLQDERYAGFFEHLLGMTTHLLPGYLAEGKSHLTIGFGCTGGQHRSVTLTETLAKALEEQGWQVSKRHRELERQGGEAPRPEQGTQA
jgi:UPF0042 nucleotide-binding protein